MLDSVDKASLLAVPLLVCAPFVMTSCGEVSTALPIATVEAASPEAERTAERNGVGVSGLGRLEPGEGVIDIGALAGDRVVTLMVEENDEVEAGDVLAHVDSHAERLAERNYRRAMLEEARVQLRRATEQGPLGVQAHEADVRRLKKEHELAQSDLERGKALLAEALLTDRDYEHQQTVAELTEETLRHAGILLEREVQTLELTIAGAQAQLASAESLLALAEATLARATVRAPTSGRVLKIFVREGEPVGASPIMQLGEAARMYAVAEVYETDVRFIEAGQRAKISSPALPQVLDGTVERIGSMIHKNDVLSVDPTADSDARIVEVRIRLDQSELASTLIHLQVDFEIET